METIINAKVALDAIKLFMPYFNQVKIRQFLTSNYFSILYYNLEMWHIPSLNAYLKQQVLAALAAGLQVCTSGDKHKIVNQNLHISNKSATPDQYMLYKHSLQLFKVFNLKEPINDWLTLNFTQTLTSRQTTFYLSTTMWETTCCVTGS